ncbi:hypothetical protein KBK19_05390 [Microvirga sp. STR05]|uniref:DUF3887 domain-containing protein n=1 Tax=Hymenobacter duratus TaxID=2771356 RepID=A0ABR8JIU5_9BACT|nr:hypothetical protein [Hymenobacter duratus]MBD2714459.1 hypothetical protein [Hymenobacter duratus]MBR7949363.1 hypothetical protein [Microvirga sp. STR05]
MPPFHARWLRSPFCLSVARRLVVGCLLLCLPLFQAVAQKPPSQVQVARQFLLAVLAGNYPAAYAFLAPEVSAAVPLARFQAAAEPLHQQGRQHQPTIDLYKLGYRISDNNTTRPFVAFKFRSDTLLPRPQVQLDVTFRDSTARQILGFGLIPAPQSVK